MKLYMFTIGDSSSCNNREEGQQRKEYSEDRKKEKSPIVELSRKYFACYDKDEERKSIIDEKVKHLTDLLRYFFCPREMEQRTKELGSKEKSPDSSKNQEEESSGTRFWQFCPPKMEQYWNEIKEKSGSKEKSPDSPKKPKEESFGTRFCATKLDDAGLKFKGVKGDRRLLDIQSLRPGVLGCIPCFGRSMEVPQLVIEDDTEVVFRNLMALEQCLYSSKTYICNYVSLMNSLINAEQDVDLLVEKNVIVNYIGSNAAVANLFSKLCFQILVSESCYGLLTQEIKGYCLNPWNRIMASIKGTYFHDFGRAIATVGVVLALLGLFIPFLTK